MGLWEDGPARWSLLPEVTGTHLTSLPLLPALHYKVVGNMSSLQVLLSGKLRLTKGKKVY
jgi:hypothetical protein